MAQFAVFVSVVVALCTGESGAISVVGAVAVAVAIGAVAYLAVMLTTVRRNARPSRVGPVAAVAVFVGVALALAAAVGLLVRWQLDAQYAAQFGAQTTVTLSGQCTEFVKVYRGSLKASDRTECANSTWQVDGRERTGTAIVAWDAHAGTELPDRIEAYALDDRAYSVNEEKARSAVAVWGGVPRWALWVGLPMAVVAAFVLARLGWTTASAREDLRDPS